MADLRLRLKNLKIARNPPYCKNSKIVKYFKNSKIAPVRHIGKNYVIQDGYQNNKGLGRSFTPTAMFVYISILIRSFAY